jgi:cytochrome c biogenesis protein CcmG/thiol:disulfide interchange protein DsbE
MTRTRSHAQERREQAARRRRRVRIGLIVGSVAIVASILAVAVTSGGGGSAGDTDPRRFSLPVIQGDGRVQLADYRGTPVVVNFFASWCTACDAELPGFSKVSRELRGDVQFVGVASLESGDALFMPKRHDIMWWPLARDIGGSQKSGLHDALGGGNSMPLTAFYDERGKLLGVDRAALPEATLRARLRDLYGAPV